MRSVLILPAAHSEIREAYDWYAQRSARSANAFEQELDRQLARIAEAPEQFAEVTPSVRRSRLRRFPYGLFFRFDDNSCYVIACFHSSRDPKRWQEREES